MASRKKPALTKRTPAQLTRQLDRLPTGRYDYSGDMERICRVCGQPFGWHLAQSPHPAYGDDIPNMLDVAPATPPRDCPGFKPKR